MAVDRVAAAMVDQGWVGTAAAAVVGRLAAVLGPAQEQLVVVAACEAAGLEGLMAGRESAAAGWAQGEGTGAVCLGGAALALACPTLGPCWAGLLHLRAEVCAAAAAAHLLHFRRLVLLLLLLRWG